MIAPAANPKLSLPIATRSPTPKADVASQAKRLKRNSPGRPSSPDREDSAARTAE